MSSAAFDDLHSWLRAGPHGPDALPMLATLSLVQQAFQPLSGRSLVPPEGMLELSSVIAGLRASRNAELKACRVVFSTTHITVRQLEWLGLSAPTIARLLGLNIGALPGHVEKHLLLRIDWPVAWAMWHSQTGLLVLPPDRIVDQQLPAAHLLWPVLPLPRQPIVRPSPAAPSLRLATARTPAAPPALPDPAHWAGLEHLQLKSSALLPQLPALLKEAGKLRRLTLPAAAQLCDPGWQGLPLSQIETLTLQSQGGPAIDAAARSNLEQFSGLRRLRLQGRADPALFEACGDACWWSRLTHLDMQCTDRARCASIWPTMWAGRSLDLQWLQMKYVASNELPIVLAARLQQLQTLLLPDGELSVSALRLLGRSHLPQLRQLDLRSNGFSIEDLSTFIESQTLPALHELAARFSSDEREDYTDWNGAIVGYGYRPMSPMEIQAVSFGDRLQWLGRIEQW